MPRITLPDGSERVFDGPVTGGQVAEAIGPRLAKAAVAAKVNGELIDLDRTIVDDAGVAIVTARDDDDDALYVIRHSTAHVMAEAICRLWPGTKLVYGPPVDNGFYYDIDLDVPLSTDDFEKIEAEMAKIIEADRPFTRYELPGDDGMAKLREEGNTYKIDNAERALEGAPAARLSWYATGTPNQEWEDLCRGPHVPGTGRLGAFKLMSVAASHWHGDVTQQQLQRIYGTAFATAKGLKQHLKRLEEAKKRDHRVIGHKLGLFAIDDQVGPGLVLWKPRGMIVRKALEEFISSHLRRQGYEQVFTPHIGKLDLFRTSGHFPYYQDSQYPPMLEHEQMRLLVDEKCSCAELANRMKSGDLSGYLLKPMNCPFHIKIYASEMRSYRDLPVRLAEFGTVYRWEQSGEISGMTRVRGFTQDDAHLFVTEDQLDDELLGCLELVKIVFNTLGMADYRVRVGMRDPDSTKYVGEPQQWVDAEHACERAAQSLGVPYRSEPGEAAFYGPKIDFVVKDVIGREWQLGTVQVDYQLPKRFNLEYIGADNKPHRPVVIHRAPFGSMERFVGVLIEHFNGAFPLWLAPQQARVLTISDKFLEYGHKVHDALTAAGLRSEIDASSERVQAKIRLAQEMKVPYMLVVGGKDEAAGTVSVRAREADRGDLGPMPLDAFITHAQREADTHGEQLVKSAEATD